MMVAGLPGRVLAGSSASRRGTCCGGRAFTDQLPAGIELGLDERLAAGTADVMVVDEIEDLLDHRPAGVLPIFRVNKPDGKGDSAGGSRNLSGSRTPPHPRTNRPALRVIVQSAQGFGSGLGDGVVIVDSTSADPDRSDDVTAVVAQRNTTGEGDQPAVGYFDVVEGATGLGQNTQLTGVHVEQARGLGLLDGDVDAAKPRAVHPAKGLEVSSGVDHGNVHQRSELLGLAQCLIDDDVHL